MNSWKVFSLSIFLLIASIGHAQVMKSIMYKKVNYFSMDNTQKRADKRYVKPGTHILGFSVSNNQHPLILHDPSVLLKAEHSEPINKYLIFLINGWSLNYQYSFPENFFVEGIFMKAISQPYHWILEVDIDLLEKTIYVFLMFMQVLV